MTEYRFTLAGRATIDARIIVESGIETMSTYGIAFDEAADVAGETESHRYSGFCPAEIVYHELHRLIAHRWGIESSDIADAVEAAGLVCTCDDGEGEE